MVDPFNPETEFDLASISEREREAINSLFAPEGPQQEIQSFLSAPSVNLAQAQKLIETRDNPQSIDILGGLATRFKEGKLPFNQQSLEDAVKNARDYSLQVQPQLMEAEKKNDWMELTKLSLGGVGKTFASFLQAGLGITNQEAEITQQSLAARNYIGQIKDPEQAAKALELGSLYQDELTSGKSIAPKDEKPAMAFGTGPLTAKLGMNLAMAENYLRDLESDSSKKLGTASLRNFAIQSGDAFLPFVSIGDIVVDENNPDLVARRAALSNSINDTIQKDYMTGTLAGAAIGSVGSFITVGGVATKALGRAAQIGDRSLKIPTVLSKGATYATIGASQSFEGDPRELSVAQRLSSVFSEGAILGLAEGAGNKLEASIDSAMANYVAAKALATKIPELAPLVGSTGKIVGVTLGETASEEIEAVLRGQDPIEPLLQNLAVSGGIGLGMAIPGISGSIVARRNKIYAMADDRFATSLEQTLRGIKTDPKLDDPRKMEEIAKLRGSLTSPKAQTLFDALNVRASVDPTLAPETAKVADEVINKSKQGTVESMLSQEISKAEGQIGVPPTIKTEAPESEEEQLAVFAELEKVFEAGAAKVELDNTPSNASKIQWLEGQGRVVGELSEDKKTYSVTNVKTDAGNWLRGIPAIEFNQELKDQFIMRAEEIGLETDEVDQMNSELEKAGTDDAVEQVARKYLGPTDYEIALESQLAKSQELVEQEKPAEINAKRVQDQINVLETKIKEAPADEAVTMREQLQKLQALQVEGQAARLVRGEESVSKLVQQFEGEVVSDIKAGKLAPELEASPNVVLPQNDPESKFFERYKKRQPDPRENNREALGSVFNLKNPATVELLQSLGAIDENGRNILTPLKTVAAYTDRKKSYLESKALARYQRYDISEQVSLATGLSFLDEIRKGESNISLSVLFNSRLRNFIEKAIPRMRAGVGQGAAISLETPGLRVNAVDAETLAEEQGLNPAVAGAINETLDQIDATETDFQVEGQVEVPSAAQRQEALAILAENFKQPFRNSLATDAEKLAFDAVVGDVKNVDVASEAAKIKTTIDDINALQPAVRTKFVQGLENNYRNSQRAGTLPFRAVEEPAGVVREGNLTPNQIKPYIERFRQLQADSFFDDAELASAKALLEQTQGSRSANMLRAFEGFIESTSEAKLSPDAITELSEAVDSNLKTALDDGNISKAQADDYINKLNKFAEPYLASQTLEEGKAKNNIAATFRSNLLRVSDQILRDSGLIMNEEGTYEQPEQLPTPKPEAKTPADRREEARARLAELEAERATTAKRVLEKAVPAERKAVGRSTERPPATTGRPGVERPRGTPIPKSFVESRNQSVKLYDTKILAPIGQIALGKMRDDQKQDAVAAIIAMENSKNHAFLLANGPGRGKTRVGLGVLAYDLNQGKKTVYLTSPEAVTPDWRSGKIGGSLQKDADDMGIPLAVRGSKEGLPIEFVPGRVLTTTYIKSYLEQILPLIDKDTTVCADEYHSARNVFKDRDVAKLIEQICQKAGKVIMMTGTPFETPDQLLSLSRLGIFDIESPEILFKRLGFKKDYKKENTKKRHPFWTNIEGVTAEDIYNRVSEFNEGLVKNGLMRSGSLKLDGVNIKFQDVPLDNQIKQQLEDIKAMYGGTQNVDIAPLRSMVAAQKRALEEYKVDAAAKRAVDAVRRGKKPVLYVGFVSDENSRGETVNPTSASLEAAITKLDPTLKIARMYTGSDQTKEQAMVSFNEENADVLITTKEMAGTGIELDDTVGNDPREMIVLSTPVSAIQAVQLIYRVWRVNSASRPNIVFLGSQAEIDLDTIKRMRDKLLLLDATVGAGFEGLRAEEVVAPVREANEATPEQISFANKTLKSIYGPDYNNGVLTLTNQKTKEKLNYTIFVAPESPNAFDFMLGEDNESDLIRVNPIKLEEQKKIRSENNFKFFVNHAIAIHEVVHVDTAQFYRNQGLNPLDEIMALGEGLSQNAQIAFATSRVYRSSSGSDITDKRIQEQIKAVANNPYFVAMEVIRIAAEIKAEIPITEEVFALTEADKKRAQTRLQDLKKYLDLEPRSVQVRLANWFSAALKIMQTKLDFIPGAKERIVMRPYVEESINHLKQLSSYLKTETKPKPVPAPEPGRSPTSPRPANKFDSYDLRIYRMIENHLEGRTDGVFGVTAADDLFKTVDVDDWLDGLDIAARRGMITNQERSLFRAATKSVMDGGRASLPGIAIKALEIAEGMEESGESLPVAAFVATTGPVNPAEPSEYSRYNVKVGFYPSYPTTAKTAAGAVANTVAKMFEDRTEIIFDGRNYTYKNRGALIAAIGRAGYDNYARRLTPAPEIVTEKPIVNSVSLNGGTVSIPVPPLEITRVMPVPAPEIRESQAIKNIALNVLDKIPEGADKDRLLNEWYYTSVSQEQQIEDARNYIAENGFDKSLQQFLAGNINASLPVQTGVAFELMNTLREKAKTDKFAESQLIDVALIAARKYGTEAGRAVQMWSGLDSLIFDNPERAKLFVYRQIDKSLKAKLQGYAEENNDISMALKDATRRAAEKFTTAKKTIKGNDLQAVQDKLGKLIDINKKGGTLSQIQAVISDYLESEEANKGLTRWLGADLAAAPEPGMGGDDIRLDPDQSRALGGVILGIIERSENPRETAASADEIKRLVMLAPVVRDAKNQETVRRKLELYFDSALTYALEFFQAKALREARAREAGVRGGEAAEVIPPPSTRGEAIQRVAQAKARAAQEAPVIVPNNLPPELALAEASADALQKQAARLQKQPRVKDALEEFAMRTRRLIAQRTKEMGGLQPVFEPLPKPTESEVLKDRIAQYPEVKEFIDNVRESLRNNYSEQELIGLEPFIEEAFGRPFAVSSLKQTVRTLESIGGPKTNLRSLIRASRGDIMDFENKMGALLTENTNLDEAKKKEVLDFLREGMTELIASERKDALKRIKENFEKKKERKTRKIRSALDKLIESANLGVLSDDDIFVQMHSQLGLPEMTQEQRKELNKKIEALSVLPKGMIRQKAINEMYQYIKFVAPAVWSDLLINSQTANLLSSAGTIGINAFGSLLNAELNAFLLTAAGGIKYAIAIPRDNKQEKALGKAYLSSILSLNKEIFSPKGQAFTAALNTLLSGNYSDISDVLNQEYGGINTFEAIVNQAEAYRKGQSSIRPELPIKAFGKEYTLPLDPKAISKKYGLLGPYIWFGRAMQAGDALIKVSVKKMAEVLEATNIAIDQGLTTQEEIEAEVARLLNMSPEAKSRAEAKAAAEAKEFSLTPTEQALRVEEIIAQNRPDEDAVKEITKRAQTLAAQTSFTNNFEGYIGLLAGTVNDLGEKAKALKVLLKFLRTGSALANEGLKFLPIISQIRFIRGSAGKLKDSKYFVPPPTPGTVEHDLLLGKMFTGLMGIFLIGSRFLPAMSGEDDPEYNIHLNGPSDQTQRESFLGAGGKLKSIQLGTFKSGEPRFVSFEFFPQGIQAILTLIASYVESVRYSKRSKVEAALEGTLAAGMVTALAMLDIGFLSGLRSIMALTSPGPQRTDPKMIIDKTVKLAGNITASFIPGYAMARDIEQAYNGLTGSPSARPYQENLLSVFLSSIPFASKIGRPDLDFLGGNIKTQMANTVPFLRRLTTVGVDGMAYNNGDRSKQAIHDKLISLFAANRYALDWNPGPLKDYAMMDLIKDAAANGVTLTPDDFFQISRELTNDEKYEWMQRAGPVIENFLAPVIPELEKMSRPQFITFMQEVNKKIKSPILQNVLFEKNQEGILFPERK